jgi:hypothetical protein
MMKLKKMAVLITLALFLASACAHSNQAPQQQAAEPAQPAESTRPDPVQPEQPPARPRQKPMGIVADLALLRPLGFAVTIGGGVVFLVSLPVTAIAGNPGEVGQVLFVEPAKYTFTRDIGDITPPN